MNRAICVLFIGLMTVTLTAQKSRVPIPVFIDVPTDKSGFVTKESKELAEVAKRVGRKLKSRDISLASTIEDARLTLYISGCELQQADEQGAVAVPIWGMVVVSPTRRWWWRLSAAAWLTGGSSAEQRFFPFTAIGFPFCKDAYADLAKQAKTWILDNDAIIRATPTGHEYIVGIKPTVGK